MCLTDTMPRKINVFTVLNRTKIVFWLNTAHDFNVHSHIFCVSSTAIASSYHQQEGKSICLGTQRSQVLALISNSSRWLMGLGSAWMLMMKAYLYAKAATGVRRRRVTNRPLSFSCNTRGSTSTGSHCTFERLLLHTDVEVF